MNLSKPKQIAIVVVMAVSFLIEFPLRPTIISTLYIISPLDYLIISIAFYAALFASLLILLKPNTTPKSILKTLCIVAVFMVFEEIMSAFFSNLNFVLVYEIIRPALIFGVIFWAVHWALKTKFNVNRVFLFIAGGLFALRAVLCVLNYIPMAATAENDPLVILDLFAATDSVYSILAGVSTYALTFVMLIFVQEKIPAQTQCENTNT